MDEQGEAMALSAMAFPVALWSAPRADQFLLLPLLLQAERPLEEGRGCGLPFCPFRFTGSSAMNSAQGNSDRRVSAAS